MNHLYLEVTGRCNMDCGHCSVRHQSETSADPPQGMLVDALAGFRAAGGEYVTFSGGEPGLRRDLPALIQEAGALGFKVTVFTNGLAARRPVLTALDRARGVLALSVDGPLAAVHETMRGPGTFRVALARLRRAVDQLGGKNVILSSVLSRPLLPELARLWEFALKERAGVLYLGVFEPIAPGVRHPLAPSDDEMAGPVARLLDLAEQEPALRVAFSESDDLLRGQAVFSRRPPEAALGHTVKLQADGWALPGPFYYAPRFRLGRPLEDGWQRTLASPVFGELALQAQQRVGAVASCGSCFWSRRCAGGSLALTWATYGTWAHACPLCRLYQATLDRAAAKEISRASAVGA